MDPSWEKYDSLSNRKIVGKSVPCRVKITVFADNPNAEDPPVVPTVVNDMPAPRIGVSDSTDSTQDFNANRPHVDLPSQTPGL